MAATTTPPTDNNNNQGNTSILEFEFDEKVYPGVTITDSENIKMIWDQEDMSAMTGFQITIRDFDNEKIADAKEQTAPRLANIIGSISGDPISFKPPKNHIQQKWKDYLWGGEHNPNKVAETY